MDQYFVVTADGKQFGPVDLDGLRRWVTEGRVLGTTLIRKNGAEPVPASTLVELTGALTGDPATGDTTLRFSALSGVSAMIEKVPLEDAASAYKRMMTGKARFRIVLTMS